MNVNRMRQIDRWLGVPVCFLLTLWRYLFHRRVPGPFFRPRRVLFVKLAEQGSTVLAYPVLNAAVQRFGAENVFFLVFAENRAIVDLLGIIPPENVIVIRAKGLKQAVFSSIAALWTLRRSQIDLTIDLEFFARSSAALTFLSGAAWRCGYHSFNGEGSYRGNLMTHRLSFNAYLHTSQTFKILLDSINRDYRELPTFGGPLPKLEAELPQFRATAREMAEVRSFLRRELRGQPIYRFVLLNANASDLMPLRRWENKRYVELAQRFLRARPDAAVIFTGAPAEADKVAELVGQVNSSRCISMAGAHVVAAAVRPVFVGGSAGDE